MSFSLDPRLAADTLDIGDLPLSRVLLMKDARYPWLILTPRRAGLTEIIELAPPERAQLMEEIALAAQALRQTAPCDKLNIGALGNVVRQLHVHVIARRVGDTAWPGPVWGVGQAVAYENIEARLSALKSALGFTPS